LKLSTNRNPPWQGNLHCCTTKDICPSLGRKPTLEGTSMAKLQGLEARATLKIL